MAKSHVSTNKPDVSHARSNQRVKPSVGTADLMTSSMPSAALSTALPSHKVRSKKQELTNASRQSKSMLNNPYQENNNQQNISKDRKNNRTPVRNREVCSFTI